jgi:hypothetical protein
MPFTPSELALWLAAPDNVDAIATLLESGDLKLVQCATGATVLKTHTNDITKYEIGAAPILPESRD